MGLWGLVVGVVAVRVVILSFVCLICIYIYTQRMYIYIYICICICTCKCMCADECFFFMFACIRV